LNADLPYEFHFRCVAEIPPSPSMSTETSRDANRLVAFQIYVFASVDAHTIRTNTRHPLIRAGHF